MFGAAAGRTMEVLAGIIFGLLLLSAVNTAIMAKVSVMYAMAHDKELPRALTRLNYSGVPWVGLLVACVAPMLVLAVSADPKALGELYAIGVVGGDRDQRAELRRDVFAPHREVGAARAVGRWGILMTLIELTIIVAKPNATIFAGVMVSTALGTRALIRWRSRRHAELPMPVPATGWLAEIERAPMEISPGKPRIMLAARGRNQAEFAVDMARKRGAALFTIYVRTLRLMDMAPGTVPQVQDDPQALEALGNGGGAGAEARGAVRADLCEQPGDRRGDPGLHRDLRLRHADHGQIGAARVLEEGGGGRGGGGGEEPAQRGSADRARAVAVFDRGDAGCGRSGGGRRARPRFGGVKEVGSPACPFRPRPTPPYRS